MPRTFSCTTLLSSSYVRNTRVKTGNTLRMMKKSASARIGRIMRNVIEMSWLMRNDTIMEKISMTGARIAIRMIIW